MDQAICEQFQIDIVDYIDGVLSGERLAALEQHLASCAACSRLVEEMRVILKETAAMDAVLPEGLHESIMDRVKAERPAGRLLRFANRKAGMIAAAFAVVIGVGMIFGTAVNGGTKEAAVEDVAYAAENYKSSAVFSRSADSAEAVAEESDDAAPMEACGDASLTAAEEAAELPTFAAVYRLEMPNMPQILREYQLSDEQAEELLPGLSEGAQLAWVPAFELEWILEVLDGNDVAYQLDPAYEPDAYAETALFILYMTK